MIGRRRRVNVTRDKLEEMAFCNRTQIELDDVRGIATTRIDGVTFWASLTASEVW